MVQIERAARLTERGHRINPSLLALGGVAIAGMALVLGTEHSGLFSDVGTVLNNLHNGHSLSSSFGAYMMTPAHYGILEQYGKPDAHGVINWPSYHIPKGTDWLGDWNAFPLSDGRWVEVAPYHVQAATTFTPFSPDQIDTDIATMSILGLGGFFATVGAKEVVGDLRRGKFRLPFRIES